MTKWSRLDPWSDDDPAIARMRDVLHPVDAPGRTEAPEVPPERTVAPESPPDESSTRRRRIAELIARLRAGDHSARQLLEDLLHG